jgi:acetolactate decarboxylase
MKDTACILFSLLMCFTGRAQPVIKNYVLDRSVQIRGAMSKVMHEGDLTSTIDIDTIADKKYLAGLGALENMTGEIIVLDGIGYKATIGLGHKLQVSETFAMKAPFFAYTHVQHWQEVVLPDSIRELVQLEHFIDQVTKKFPRPFIFRVITTADSAHFHVLNLPQGYENTFSGRCSSRTRKLHRL